MTPSAPRVKQFRDPVAYLAAVYRYRKGQDPTLRVRSWASAMGMDPPELLVLLLQRKRKLKLKHVEYLKTNLGLDRSEELFLGALIQLAGAVKPEEERFYALIVEQLAAAMDHGSHDVARVDDPQLYSHWMDAAVPPLVDVLGDHFEPERACDRLRDETITPAVVKASIEKLARLNLLKRHEDGNLTPTRENIATGNDVTHVGARKYYRQVSELAKHAADLPTDSREYQCFAMSLNSGDLPLFKEMFRDFRARLSAVRAARADQVYQVNLQFFPLTRTGSATEGTCSGLGPSSGTI